VTFRHRHIVSSGHRIHLVESGPTDGHKGSVVFVHGFPESWYSWRHQLKAIGDARYRAVAMDVRGYGRSARPADVGCYAMSALVGDVIAVIDDLGRQESTIVGHDWGAPIAWNTALLRPDRVKGVAGLSVPYSPRGDNRPLESFRAFSGDELFYIDYFQKPGVVEAEVERDLESWLRGFYFTASGEADANAPSMGFVRKGGELRERLQQPSTDQMKWMTSEDFAFYLEEFERTGLTGGFNRYRNIERDWEELAPFHGAPIIVPALFIGGELDGPTQLGMRAIERFGNSLPKLTKSEILPGCGHWTQQEQPEPVNQLLLNFLSNL